MNDNHFLQPSSSYDVMPYSITNVYWDLVVRDDEIEAFNQIFSDDRMRTKEGIKAFSEYVEGVDGALGNDPFPLFHNFGAGTYTREIHMPKGYVVIGKIHRHESMVYMLKGKVLVSTEEGVKIVEAPCQFVSKPGIKRVGYVIEDVVWIDIHAIDKMSIEEAEKEIFMDYEEMVNSLGYSVDEVRAISENEDDMIPMPEGYSIEIKNSDIEGKGVFATKDMTTEDHVGIARIKSSRTPLGRFTNHSFSPNARPMVMNESIYFLPVKNINNGEEITVDYQQVRKSAEELDDMLINKTNNGWSLCQA